MQVPDTIFSVRTNRRLFRGMVHLTINGQVRMLEIVEWTANAAKVKIPADLQAGSQAQIERATLRLLIFQSPCY